MLLDLEYRHVDVFSRRALRGNGLVVVLDAAGLPAAVMQDVTREVRQFETAFLTDVDLAGGSARLRIFTEDEELGFAGHPVLGAAAVLHTLVPASGAEQAWALTVAQRTVAARTRGAAGWIDATMDQGVPHFGPAIAGEPSGLTAAPARTCDETLCPAGIIRNGRCSPGTCASVMTSPVRRSFVPTRSGTAVLRDYRGLLNEQSAHDSSRCGPVVGGDRGTAG